VSPAVIDFKELTQRAQRSTERTEEIVNDRSMGFPSPVGDRGGFDLITGLTPTPLPGERGLRM